MILTRIPKSFMCNFVRLLASRKHGPFRKVPHLPVKGPRDFDYWKQLKRKGTSKKEHFKENTYRTNQLRKKKQPPKKKCEDKPVEN